MKTNLIIAPLAIAGMAVGYSLLSTDQCGLVVDGERRSVLQSITPDLLSELGLKRSVNAADVCHMPVSKLKRAIYRVEMPKPDHPGEAAAFRYESLLDENGELDSAMVFKAQEQVKAMQRVANRDAGLSTESWESLGPGNIGGRTRSFVFDPNNSDRMLLGSVAGGLWETTNGGGSWAPVNDFLANLAITTITYDPTDGNVVYAGTGEGFYNGDAIKGLGVFKSTDNGKTWQGLEVTASNSDFEQVNRLAMTSDGGALYSATNGGIWKSTDDGATWREVYAGISYVFDEANDDVRTIYSTVQDIDISSKNDQHLLAGAYGAPVYSEDGGETWAISAPFPFIEEVESEGQTVKFEASMRVETVFAKSNADIAYASIERNGGELYRSNDGGKTFELVNTGTGYLGSQGWYDNAIWVDPVDPDHLVVGGIDLWRSQDGGQTFAPISTWWASPQSAHADHHIILEHPDYDGQTNKAVFFGNDGGIYKAEDMDAIVEDRAQGEFSGWTALNNNLGITQFYGMGVAPDGTIVGGTQDNGTLILKPEGDTESWYETFGGDGGYSAADPTDSNYIYGEYVYLQIHRSTNGGLAWPEPGFSNWIHHPDMSDGALFIAPFILDPNEPNRMLAGANKLWLSANVKDEVPTWSVIKPVTESGSSIKSIAVASGNSDLIVIGHYNGEIYKTLNGTAAEPEWVRIDTEDMPARANFRLAIDPVDHNTMYASFSGYQENNFWRTQDGGTTWTAAMGAGVEALPTAPIRAIAVHPTNPNRVYVGTEVGVFASEDKGNSWSISNDGPANVAVDELIWQDENTLLAATHGRGIFRATLKDVTVPDGLSFDQILEVPVNSVQTSNAVVLSGLTVRSPVSIDNGEYSLNCDAATPTFTSQPGRLANGMSLCVRHTSSTDTFTETVSKLTIGSASYNFTTKTVADRTPNRLSFTSVQNAPLNQMQVSNTVTVTGIDVPVAISVIGGEYAKGCNASGFTSAAGTIASGETFCLRHTSSNSNRTAVSTRVTVGEGNASFTTTTEEQKKSGGAVFYLLALALLGLRRKLVSPVKTA